MRHILTPRHLLLLCVLVGGFALVQELTNKQVESETASDGTPPFQYNSSRFPPVIRGERDMVEFAFPYRNDRDVPLSLSLVAKGCGCNRVRTDSANLEVGEFVSLPPSGTGTLLISAPIQDGATHVQGNVAADVTDGTAARADIELRGHAQVYDAIECDKAALVWDFPPTATPPEPKTVRVEFRTRRPDSDAVCAWESREKPQLSVEITRQTGPPQLVDTGIYRVVWSVTCRPLDGSLRALAANPTRLTLYVTEGGRHAGGKWLAASARQTTGIEHPAVVECGATPIGVPASRKFLIRAADQRAFSLLSATVGPQAALSYETGVPKLVHWVELKCTPADVGDASFPLVITTDHPSAPRLELSAKVTGTKD